MLIGITLVLWIKRLVRLRVFSGGTNDRSLLLDDA